MVYGCSFRADCIPGYPLGSNLCTSLVLPSVGSDVRKAALVVNGSSGGKNSPCVQKLSGDSSAEVLIAVIH